MIIREATNGNESKRRTTIRFVVTIALVALATHEMVELLVHWDTLAKGNSVIGYPPNRSQFILPLLLEYVFATMAIVSFIWLMRPELFRPNELKKLFLMFVKWLTIWLFICLCSTTFGYLAHIAYDGYPYGNHFTNILIGNLFWGLVTTIPIATIIGLAFGYPIGKPKNEIVKPDHWGHWWNTVN